MTNVVIGQHAVRLVTLVEGQTFNEVILCKKDLSIKFTLDFYLFNQIGFKMEYGRMPNEQG